MRSEPIPILMYHSIAVDPPAATRRLSVAPEAFDDQMQRLRRLGCTTVTFSELSAALESGRELPERVVALTFDDGYADFCTHALPVLERNGFTATVFVTTGWIDGLGPPAASPPLDRMLTPAQVQRLPGAGIEVGAHSHSHAQLDQISAAALEAELRMSRRWLEELTGRPVETMAYPYGYSTRRVRQAAGACGYRYAAAVGNRCAHAAGDPLALPRLTVRRSTSLHTFERVVRIEGVDRAFLLDRALTRGFSVVRQGRRLGGHVRRHD